MRILRKKETELVMNVNIDTHRKRNKYELLLREREEILGRKYFKYAVSYLLIEIFVMK
jgi:hypothetical protein